MTARPLHTEADWYSSIPEKKTEEEEKEGKGRGTEHPARDEQTVGVLVLSVR